MYDMYNVKYDRNAAFCEKTAVTMNTVLSQYTRPTTEYFSQWLQSQIKSKKQNGLGTGVRESASTQQSSFSQVSVDWERIRPKEYFP